jgi:hypothetical protein
VVSIHTFLFAIITGKVVIRLAGIQKIMAKGKTGYISPIV